MEMHMQLRLYQKVINSLILDEGEVNVKEYSSGDYFGELSLIKNELRAANVYAKVTINL